MNKVPTIKDNNVPVKNQMKNSNEYYFLGDSLAKTRILILGNSITRHGPSDDLKWYNDFGMAASSKDKDYVHVLYNKLYKAKKDVYFMVYQSSFWEINYKKEDVLDHFTLARDFKPDVIIFRLGENVVGLDWGVLENEFQDKLDNFMNYLKTPSSKILLTTTFWEYPCINTHVIPNLSNKYGVEYADLCILGKLSKNMALGKFEHSGVAMHPGDLGMKNIAESIFNKLIKII